MLQREFGGRTAFNEPFARRVVALTALASTSRPSPVTHMQHIRFGLSIDSGAGAHFSAAVGRSALGPLGLLNVLETHLGLLRAPVSQSERVVQMRQCLRAAMTAPRFYATQLRGG
jgi:hypothetical protein